MRLISGRTPVVIAALLITLANFAFMAERIFHAQPNNPWEAGHVVDGWRFSHGWPVYEDPRTGHATTMYGPLLSITLGAIFKLTGANNYAGRILQTVCGLLAVTLLAYALTRGQPKTNLLIGCGLLLGINLRTWLYFSDTRPDAACLLFTITAVLLMYRASWRSYLCGLIALLIAFYFKQTGVVGGGIVCLAYLFRYRREPRWWLRAFLPILLLLVAVLLTKLCWPLVYYYMIVVPAQNPIRPIRLAIVPVVLLNTMPLFFVALIVYLRERQPLDKTGVWFIAALLVTSIYGIVSTARLGGDLNSLMPTLAALFGFVVWQLQQLLAPLDAPLHGRTRRVALGCALGLAMIVTMLQYPDALPIYAAVSHGDGHYRQVIEIARRLPGKVVCPPDPTIPLYAKSYAGRQLAMEMDAAGLSGSTPDYVLAEVASADYVIQVNRVLGDQYLTDKQLAALGFQPVEFAELQGSVYHIWAAKH